MQLSNAPLKIVLPWASGGGKNVIPINSQIGIVPGAASLTDGFPPLTRTPISAGGVAPSGLDMNGILFEISAQTRWGMMGAGYTYDATFAADSNVGGYPKGARILRTDAQGYWLNTVDNNTTDPEAGGAGWVPDFQYGSSNITMTSANVTLTSLQAGKRFIYITGTLTANLNLIFPTYIAGWTIVNNTTGAFSITAKTAAGTGVTVTQGSATQVYGDGTNIYNVNVAASSGQNNDITALLALTGAVDFSRSTVAATATTTPMWTATTGMIQDWTGTPTITALPNAPKAGAWRRVYPAAGTIFTNNANLSVQGGANYTVQTGDEVVITATTTSTFTVAINKKDGTDVVVASSAEAQALSNAVKSITPATLAAAFQGANQLLGASGYQKLPGGTILQWGVATVGGAGTTPVSFPITFPTACDKVITGITYGGSGTPSAATAAAGTLTTTGFNLGSSAGLSCAFLAIGR